MRYLRKPLNIERWGKLELWEAMDAAYILGGTEPERGNDAYLTTKAAEVSQAILAAYALNTLKPYQVTESGSAYYLAFEVVKWAKEKGFNIPSGLEAVVHATSLSFLTRHDAAKEALLRESSFTKDLLNVWIGKDLWSEDELVSLLCGIKPEAFNGNVLVAIRNTEQAAREAIQRAIAVGVLSFVWEEEKPAQWHGKYVPSKTLQYFAPSDVIPWAKAKQSEFPKFPAFAEIAKIKKLPMSTEFSDLGDAEPVAMAVPTIAAATTPAPTRSIRIMPQGGDFLTRMIWEICYAIKDAGDKPKPLLVMRELQIRAQSTDPRLRGKLMSETADGVKFEDGNGDERELNRNQLAARINEWKQKQ